jgi:hypothetical protein
VSPSGVDAKTFRDAEEAARDNATMRTACAFCSWKFEGTAAECRSEATAHRLQAHPEIIPKRLRRHRVQLHTFRQHDLDEEDRSDIQRERAKRARLHGVEIEE